ncbi:MAG: LysM peptidoglycan-binding domain-containing protein [Acidimicrobiales bacterium]
MGRGRAAGAGRAGQVVRGLLALVFVVAVVVGIPIALINWVGWPLPRVLPDPSEVSEAIRSSYVPEDTLLKVIACVCWIIWAQLLASLLVESFAYVRGRRAGHIPFTGGLQRAAAKLIATIALVGALAASRGTVGSVQAAGKPLVAPDAARATLVVDPFEKAAPSPTASSSEPPADWGPAATTAPAELPVYVVQRYDSLWDIAERHLGDGFRWREIWDLNNNVVQPDGHRLVSPDRIQVGWRLSLPGDAVNLPETVAAVPAPVPGPGAPADGYATPPSPASPSPATPAPYAPYAPDKVGGVADRAATSDEAPDKAGTFAEAILPGGEAIPIDSPYPPPPTSPWLDDAASHPPRSDLPDDDREAGAKPPPFWSPPDD